MKRTIAMTVYDRPGYTLQVLRKLRECIAVGDWGLVVSADGHPAHDGVLRAVDVSGIREEMEVAVHPAGMRLGPHQNIKRAIDSAFLLESDIVVYLQDDVLPGQDWLLMAEWFAEYAGKYLCLFGFNPRSANPDDCDDEDQFLSDFVLETRGELAHDDMAPFYSLSWACGSRMWADLLKPYWEKDPRGCDWSLARIFAEHQVKALVPAVSRCAHIGRIGGTYYRPEIHDRIYHEKPWFDGFSGPYEIQEAA